MHSRPDTLIPDGADASIYAGASPDTSRQPQPAAGAMTDAEMSSSLEGTDAERIASDKRSKILREMVAKSLATDVTAKTLDKSKSKKQNRQNGQCDKLLGERTWRLLGSEGRRW